LILPGFFAGFLMDKALKKGPGRPALKLPEGGLERIKQLASEGHTQTSISYALGLARDGLQRLKKRPGGDLIEKAIHEGKAKEQHSLHSKLYEKAMAGEVVPLIFLLKARHGYVEASEQQLPQSLNVQITLPGAASPKQYSKIIEGEVVKPKLLETDET